MQIFKEYCVYLLVYASLTEFVKGFTFSSFKTTEIQHSNAQLQENRLATRLNEKPGWLEDAMEGIPSGEFDAESYKNAMQLKPGIAGFSVDPELGFVSILVTNDEIDDEPFWIPAIISPVDKDRPKSAEALTCVQLAGGLDLGTTILPPNALTKLVADNNPQEEDMTTDASKRLSLTKITALPNPDASDDTEMKIEEDAQELVPTSPERDNAILEAVPKVEKAIKTLPGLQDTTTEEVTKAVQRFADPKGAVDRTAFSSILDSLRESNTPTRLLASPLFRLEVSIIDEGGISQATIDTSDAMIALGLAMRYKVTIEIDDFTNHKQGGKGKDALLERFPAFRPIQELNEDSKIIDGFIPSMFEKAKLDNDMKSE